LKLLLKRRAMIHLAAVKLALLKMDAFMTGGCMQVRFEMALPEDESGYEDNRDDFQNWNLELHLT
jgi:hypothetical protein